MGLPNTVNQLFNGGSPYYIVNRSLRFRSSASAYLNRTPSVAGTRTKFTYSAWVKRGALGINGAIFDAYSDVQNYCILQFFSDNTLSWYNQNGAATITLHLNTTQVFRDPGAWYHILVNYDSTQATSTDRAAIYINGVKVTAFGTATYPSLNTTAWANATVPHDIGRYGGASNYFDGYLAEVNFVDGQALTPSSFGAFDTNGIWQPIRYAGTYGTNGFYLPFSNTTSTTTLVQDSSGNGNNWTANNISLTAGTTYDSMIDSPTVSASSSNYAVLNPLDKNSNIALSDGNLTAIPSSTADYWLARATMQLPSSGKWYWELTLNNTPYLYQAGIYSANRPTNGAISATGNEYQVAWGTAYTYIQYQSNNAAFAAWGTNTNPTSGNVLMFAVDSDNATMWIGRNGTWYNTSGTANPATNTDPRFSSIPSGLFAGVNLPNPASGGVSMNFGQRPFSYTPPSGYNALNTANLPQPLISNGANYMAASTWTGDGTSPRTFTNGGNNTLGTTFQPDLVWIKMRSGAYQHVIADSVRGGNAILHSNSTSAEDVNWQYGYLQSFNSNGFTAQSGSTSIENINLNGSTFVGWQWKAGAGTTSTNTSGSITSTVSVSAQSGFSVVTYTGNGTSPATVGHGLGVAPDWLIFKNRDAAQNWESYHSVLGATKYIEGLNTTAAAATSTIWNNTSPTSSVFTINGADVNTNGRKYVVYCWAAVRGYSAFGSYTGNGSTDGPFVYTGFRPRFILWKQTSAAGQDWQIEDTSREPYNSSNRSVLFPDLSNAEITDAFPTDFLSNGFKIRNSGNGNNQSGQTYIYAAFAESPFNISRAR